jgi:DNA invertase Pin-like site-specific DNA recombinase
MAKKAISNEEWKPGIYGRLSYDDGRAGLSLSIEHQLEILRRYVKDHGWQTPKEYYDGQSPHI